MWTPVYYTKDTWCWDTAGSVDSGLVGDGIPSWFRVRLECIADMQTSNCDSTGSIPLIQEQHRLYPYVEPSQHFQKQSIQPLPEPYNIAPDNIPSFISHHQPSSIPSKPRPFKQTNSTSPSLQSSQKFQGRQCKRSDQTAISICLNSPHLQYHPINPNKSPDPGISKAVTYSISYTTTVILLP
ncbi:hypothetical protein QC763_308555 [Podospora pseudopauciseta]|uniref:Uncharacterized protein n=1 Tax=Podospora pseudopauciseta TaxID=2093780 RepID=A0ABR0HHM0_9PEZI|nr:hypothetical protein QC763_308555 [Podospora pseudopauciseta]